MPDVVPASAPEALQPTLAASDAAALLTSASALPLSPACEEKPNDPQFKFLVAALQDAQGVIRATDTKVTALSAAMAIPLTKLGAIWAICTELIERVPDGGKWFAVALVVMFSGAWVLSIAAALRTLLHIDNPAPHVGGNPPSGIFYSAVLFRPSFIDLFFQTRPKLTADFSTFFTRLPTTDVDVRRELAFELMKVAFIRTIKLKRARVTYGAFFAWVASGGAIWTLNLVLKAYGS